VQGPTGTHRANFDDVSCTAVDWCLAVGVARTPSPSTQYFSQVQVWDGATWSTVASPVGAANGAWANLVACATPDLCVASIQNGLPAFERWDGAAWHVLADPREDWDDDPAMACAPDGSCTIVDGTKSTRTVLADGSSTIAKPAGHPFVTDLWCAAAGDCLGFNRNIGSAFHWNGSAWSARPGFPVPTGSPVHTSPQDVTCGSPTSCMAVGNRRVGPAGTPFQAWSMHWDGTTWTEHVEPAASVLWNVSCPTASECVAHGYSAADPGVNAVLAWNGQDWFEAPAPTDLPSLYTLDCVALRCLAVGSNGPVTTPTLAAERYDWTNP
jgi:hypothetical protein